MNLSAPDLGLSLLLPLLLLGLGTMAAGARICRYRSARAAGIVLAVTGALLVAGVVLEAAELPSAWTVTVATRLTGPVAVLLYPRIVRGDRVHWVLIGLCAIAGSVAVLAPPGLWTAAAMMIVAVTVAGHLWWRGGRRERADRRAVFWAGLGVVAAVVAYAVLAFAPSLALPVGSQALAAACVPAAMVLGVRRPDPRGRGAVATSIAVTAAAALLAAAVYVVIILLLTQATGRPTLIIEEALVALLCAGCLGPVRGSLQKWVDGRRAGAHVEFPAAERLIVSGSEAGMVIGVATVDAPHFAATVAHEGLGRRLAGIARSTDTLSDLLEDERGVETAAARQLVAVVQMEAAAALEEIRRLSPSNPV